MHQQRGATLHQRPVEFEGLVFQTSWVPSHHALYYKYLADYCIGLQRIPVFSICMDIWMPAIFAASIAIPTLHLVNLLYQDLGINSYVLKSNN